MKLIDKAAVLLTLERRRDAALMRQQNLEAIGQETVLNEMVANEMNKIISLINTLEVKEVDLNLDNELDKYIKNNNAFVKDDFIVEKNNGDSFNHIYDLEPVAKHFFELGLKSQQGIKSED